MKQKKDFTLIMIFPALAIFSIFIFFPIVRTLYLSFFDWNMISSRKKFVLFNNYKEILMDTVVYRSLGNTLLYIIFLIIFNFILPYIFAYVVGLLITKLKNFYKSILFFPSIISLVVASLLFLWIFNPMTGVISQLYQLFKVEPRFWLKTNGLVVFLISLTTAWKIFGYNLILLLAGILEIPKEIIESAKIDNISNFKIFIYIIFPLTSSTALYIFTMTIVYGLQQVFVPINVLTQGGPDNRSTNIVYSIYQYAFTFFQTGRASSLAIITTLFFFVIVSIKIKILEKGVYYEN